MADTSNSREKVLQAARLINDHKGEDTVVLDLSGTTTITDFFVITTARNAAHMTGLLRALALLFKEQGIHPLHGLKGRPETGWLLLDCGDFVIHIMQKEQRDFYELERLWFRAVPVSY